MATQILQPGQPLNKAQIDSHAKAQVKNIILRAAMPQINYLIRCGRKRDADVPLYASEREALREHMTALNMDGVIDIPAQVLKDDSSSVLLYEQICIELFKALD